LAAEALLLSSLIGEFRRLHGVLLWAKGKGPPTLATWIKFCLGVWAEAFRLKPGASTFMDEGITEAKIYYRRSNPPLEGG
jgi:hypothetical protein